MHYIVDRIESGIAVCNCTATGGDVEIRADDLPAGTREGHVLVKTEGGYVYDEELTKERLRNLTERMNRLFRA